MSESDTRYGVMPQRRSGASGLVLPAVTLGLWHNFGAQSDPATMRDIVHRAFDLGVFHFDLANNYGPPYGHAEEFFGDVLAEDFRPYRDELVVSTKAGWTMWNGPFGTGGSRKYLTASLDQSLSRLGLDYVDIFYSHRFDPDVPLEETMGALASAVHQGKALYVGISSYSPTKTKEAASILKDLGIPLTIHQPSYSMFNRWIEYELLDVLGAMGIGCIGFSVLAQGLCTTKYINGIPKGSRADSGDSFDAGWISDDVRARVHGLDGIASLRDQTLAQMAIAWALRDTRMTSALIGASSVAQLEENIAATHNLQFSTEELDAIDQHAVDATIDLWSGPRLAG